MELTDIKKALTFEGHSPERRIHEALGLIEIARKGGAGVYYMTRTEERVLANSGDLIFVARELVRIMDTPLEKLIPDQTPILAIARDLLHNLNVQPDAEPPAASSPRKRTWQCPACGRVETVSAVYDAKVCPSCNVRMTDLAPPPVRASSPPSPAASSAPSQPLAQTMQKLRDLSQAMLGVLDCKNPDGTARGEALAAWIELRETLDVYWLDCAKQTQTELAGRDLDSSCGD